MIVFLTKPQLAIAKRAAAFFRERLANKKVRSMFRQYGPHLSVGLTCWDDGHTFVVREVIYETASDDEIDAACGRIVKELARSYGETKRELSSAGE